MKDYITASSVANTVRLLRTQWNGAVVICEGATDARIFSRFVDSKYCRIEIAHGKDNAIDALGILQNAGIAGVLAVVDRDCFLLNSALALNPHIIATDSHDLETMVIQSPALEKVIGEFASATKLQTLASTGRSVRDVLCESAFPLGHLRIASLRNNLRLKFEGCGYGNFIDRDTLAVNESRMIADIINKTRNHTLNPTAIAELMQAERKLGMNAWDVCCGHDLTEILGIGLRKLLGSCDAKEVDSGAIERSLRLAYEATHFKLTQLCADLASWEARNLPYKVLV